MVEVFLGCTGAFGGSWFAFGCSGLLFLDDADTGWRVEEGFLADDFLPGCLGVATGYSATGMACCLTCGL